MGHGNPAFAYRPDIDGLRAFAVLSVLTFHAFPSTLKGGFIGVDVFFVISGYLICGILLRDLEAGTFSFADFYARRVRRIFPALIVVLAAVLGFGWFALLPDEYEALGKHVFGGSLFASNIVLWKEAGYFDVAAKVKPLLHLWSLGIEEQYYIVFPFILWCCAKKYVRAAFIVGTLCLLSFLDNIYLHHLDRVSDFYSPLSRIWELLAGAGLAAIMRQNSSRTIYLKLDALCSRIVYSTPQKNDGRALSFLLAFVGAFFLGIALLLARESDPYPGWRALLPVTGAVLMIAAGPLNPITQYCLTNRLSVFIGKISYPLYLWHWALISYAWIIVGELDKSTRLLRTELVLASIFLSIITYYFIEKPIRFWKKFSLQKTILLSTSMILISVTGLYIIYNNGIQNRFSKEYGTSNFQKYTTSQKEREDAINFLKPLSVNTDYEYANFKNNNCKETIAIIGDSHAENLYYGFSQTITQKNVLMVGNPGHSNNDGLVLPLLYWDKDIITQKQQEGCERFKKIYKFIVNNKNISDVIINLRGPAYLSGNEPAHSNENWNHFSSSNFFIYLQNTINYLCNADKKVYLVIYWQELPSDIRNFIGRPFRKSKKDCILTKDMSLDRQKTYRAVLSDIKNATIIDTINIFFENPNRIKLFDDESNPIYADDDHITTSGSLYLAQRIINYIVALENRQLHKTVNN